jgi:hypothetical protein
MLTRITFMSVVAAVAFVAAPAIAQTADGETPAEESVCDGQMGAAFGLCDAYCEAMDCDSFDPQATETACNTVFDKFQIITGTPPPCEVQCPCFDATDIQTGDIAVCGDNFDGFPDLAGVIYQDTPFTRFACSGDGCVAFGELSCRIIKITGEDVFEIPIPQDEDAVCRAIILENCANPNILEESLPKLQSVIPFMDQ